MPRIPRAPRMPRDLHQVMEDLGKIHNDSEPDLHIDEMLAKLRDRIADAVAAGSGDEQITETVDRYVDTFVSEWRATMLTRHRRVLNQLDMLKVKVRPYLERSDALHEDELSKLTHLDGAVSHALDRVSDPDTPFIDPLPRPRRTEH